MMSPDSYENECLQNNYMPLGNPQVQQEPMIQGQNNMIHIEGENDDIDDNKLASPKIGGDGGPGGAIRLKGGSPDQGRDDGGKSSDGESL